MKSFIVSLLLFVGLISCAFVDDNRAFQKFTSKFNRLYESKEEQDRRFSIFVMNLRETERMNARATTYRVGINRFADMTRKEMATYLMAPIDVKSTLNTVQTGQVGAFPIIDWRDEGMVTEVQDQGNCGSCWAFCTTATLEVENAIKNSVMEILSSQQLVDCDTRFNAGCEGGNPGFAYEYIMRHGLTTEKAYPYIAYDSTCKPFTPFINLKEYVRFNDGNEGQIHQRIVDGALSVGIHASFTFQMYIDGILDDTTCRADRLNHGVTIVGTGEENGLQYYIIKNSWGASWGEQGYIRLATHNKNTCGIASMASYPVGVTLA